MAGNGGYQIGDVANGYVLTEHGWTPVPPVEAPTPPQYQVGDVANGSVLTEQGWKPLAPGGGTPGCGNQPSGYASQQQEGCAPQQQPPYGGQPAYQPQPAHQPQGTSPGSRKTLLIVVAVVAVLAVGFVGSIALVISNARNNGGVSRRR